MAYFIYTEDELISLKKKDKKLCAVIEKTGMIEREITPDLYTALMESIIGQQISAKAADTVSKRFLEKTNMNYNTVCNMDIEEIQKLGMSVRKAEYIKNTSLAFKENTISFEKLKDMDDIDVIKTLSSLKGIGVWTAEMMLIFCFNRKNILSFGDLAIRRGLMTLYGHKEITKELYNKYKKRYSPYGSIASLYLWELSHDERILHE